MAVQTHKVEVVRVQIEPHPNADRLDVARIYGFTCCVAKGSFEDGPSMIPGAGHIREGIVVRPIPERNDPHQGRVHLKLVSNSFLEKDK